MSEPAPASPLDQPPQPELDRLDPAETLQDVVILHASNSVLELTKNVRYTNAVAMLLAKKVELANTTFEGLVNGVVKDDNTKRSRATATRTKLYTHSMKEAAYCVGTYSRECKRTISWLERWRDVCAELKALPPVPLDKLPVDDDVERMIRETKQRRKMIHALRPKKTRRAT